MTVFVVQNQKTIYRNTGELKDKFDFGPAEQFGRVEFLLSPSARPFNLASIQGDLQYRLRGFSDSDFLLLTGSPVFIGLAVAIAADYNLGNVAMLQWSGAKRTYYPIYGKAIFAEPENDEDHN